MAALPGKRVGDLTSVHVGAHPGKRVGNLTYVHVDALDCLDGSVRERVCAAGDVAGLRAGVHYNLVRVAEAGGAIALLHYPGFFEEPFPMLRERWLVEPDTATVAYRTWEDSRNPPILHRKELMLAPEDPRRGPLAELTAACEAVGLFDDPARIGYLLQWSQLIRDKGFRLDDHRLVPVGNQEDDADAAADDGATPADWAAARQRTALVRYGFSAPIQLLARHGFLDGRYRLFDYGCGRGDDLRGLAENGLTVSGWDPYYAPDNSITAAELVNLGFVINVIEDFDERLEALTRAWSLAGTLLVVSVMLANQNEPRGEAFRDGVMTRRGTFQRYYTQAGLKAFVDEVLDEQGILVAPGVLYVFRDKDAEQRFLLARASGRGHLLRPPRPRPPRPERRDRAAERHAAWQPELERLWARWLALGRRPEVDDLEDAARLIEGFGTLGRTLRFLEERRVAEEGAEAIGQQLAAAEGARRDDLTVYFALARFARRRPYTQVEAGLKRDIRRFFGDYAGAQAAGTALLMRIADVAAIAQACREAAEHGLGWLEEAGDAGDRRPRALQLGAALVEQLPPLLRTYIGAAAAAYGDWRGADLIKVHIGSGKLTLMRFDDFDGVPLPRMVERVKIKLREQDVEYYAYGDGYEPPFLYHKSRFINEEHPTWPAQLAFEAALDGLGLFDWSGYGPAPGAFLATLARHRWEVQGFSLRRVQTIPALDDPCGRHLTFRQLIECGETQAATGLANLPREPDSYNALLALAEQVLDPLIDWFGMPRLTYGFCSPALARLIPARIDPRRDQHACHERNRAGRLVCERLGAAVDLLVEDEDMGEVARWIVEHTPFDRLYFYGADLPVHVSHGPEQARQIVEMRLTRDGRRVPRVVSVAAFLGEPDAK